MYTASRQRHRRWCGQMSALLLIFSLLLPFAQLAFCSAEGPGAVLPACCRAHGKHHCAMRMLRTARGKQTSSTPQAAQVKERCPYAPGLAPSTHINPCCNDSHRWPACYVEDQSVSVQGADARHTRIIDRANQKRGPPNSSEIAQDADLLARSRLPLPKRWRGQCSDLLDLLFFWPLFC